METKLMIGQRLRQIRKDLSLSLRDLSERSGVSVGALSQLERSLGKPSLRTIERISVALGVPPFWLLDTPGPETAADETPVVRAGQGIPLTVLGEGMAKTLITPRNFGAMQLMMIEMQPGAISATGYFRHAGVDVGYMLAGSLNLEVDGRTYVLSAGDSFAFDSDLAHRFENRGGSVAQVLWINTKAKLDSLPPEEPAKAADPSESL